MVLQSLLPSHRKSVNQCWREMAASPTERSWCVLEFAWCNSFVAVQRAFRQQFGRHGPPETLIRRCYKKFRYRGCICHHEKSCAGRPSVTKETVDRVRETFTHSPRKSVRRASWELKIPEPTVRKLLWKQLQLYLYKLQLVQKLQPDDPPKQLAFCEDLLSRMETDQGLPERVIFSDEVTFFLSGKVNRHNTRIWGSQNLHALIEMERDSPKVNVFCAIFRRCVFGPFFFAKDNVTGKVYLDMLENWLMPQLADEEVQGYIYQQEGAPPHWHKEVREYLNEHLPGRWVGHAAATDNTFCTWPPQSPDLTVCDFFLWGFVKYNVHVPPLPKTVLELRERINTAIGNVTQDMLERVWREWEYRLDICRVTRGSHIECI